MIVVLFPVLLKLLNGKNGLATPSSSQRLF